MSEFKPVILSLKPSSACSLAVEILPYGLTIHRVLVEAYGCTHDIVVGPEYPESHATQKYTNTIVGRYANRIPAGTHILERHGIKNEFTPVANESPRVSLHGGPKGFDAAIWTPLSPDEPAALFTAAELGHLSPSTSAPAIFRLISESGDQGYPGKLIVEAFVALVSPGSKYGMHDDYTPHETSEYDLGSIVIAYRAKLDEGENKVVTPVNLTQHWGFNLNASLKDEPISIKDHILTIKADRFAELDSDGLGTGLLMQTADYPPHVHTSKRIGEHFPEKGYDHFYLFQNPATASAGATTRISLAAFNAQFDLIGGLLQTSGEEPRLRNRPEPVVEISSPKSGLKLAFDTNQAGVMFYANGMADPSAGARKRIHGGSGLSGKGDSYGPESAAFLEFHAPLAAFLDPKNKDGEDGLITTAELYHAYVRCDISLKPSEEGK